MASDWGSAFTGQEVNFVIAFRNTQKTGDLKNIRISSALPDNLELQEPKSDVGEAQRQGNLITLNLASLGPDKGVEITVRAKIKANVAIDTRLVSQAEATYDGLAQPLRSNIVTVLVVGQALARPAAELPTATGTRTSAPNATSSPGATTSALPTATSTTKPPLATPTPKPAPELPNTSTGIPLSGFALLGLTLLLRTVRLHRAQTRI
jgi:hypothetical protein